MIRNDWPWPSARAKSGFSTALTTIRQRISSYHLFATALHEPLGLLLHDGDLYTTQRSELTRLRDTDGDGVADEYLTAAKGWGVTGHYHEYAYGPKVDGDGNLWITLNIGMGLSDDQRERVLPDAPLGYRQGRWRGWGMKLTPEGELIPVCAGMRSPSGIGVNWTGRHVLHRPARKLGRHQLASSHAFGAFFHHAEALASIDLPGSPIDDVGPLAKWITASGSDQAVSDSSPAGRLVSLQKGGTIGNRHHAGQQQRQVWSVCRSIVCR